MYGDAFWKRNLTDPPRDIAPAVIIQLLLGGVVSLCGWVFLGFGLVFFWIFVVNSDLPAWWRFRGALETVPGTVIAVEETSFSEGGSEHSRGTPVYAYHYRFTHEGQPSRGTSYRLGTHAELDEAVTVEFPRGKPHRSRIRGYRTAPFSPYVSFVVIFPAVGLIIVAARLRVGWKHRHLLKYGELAAGRLVSRERTNTEINDQPVYKLTFEFETSSGKPAELVVKTHNVRPLSDDDLETLLYDPADPSFGTTLDHLPGRPHIQADGTIAVDNAGYACLSLTLPALTILGHGTYFLWRYVL